MIVNIVPSMLYVTLRWTRKINLPMSVGQSSSGGTMGRFSPHYDLSPPLALGFPPFRFLNAQIYIELMHDLT